MAQPLRHVSQFVPTNFGQIGNILGMYRQDMQQRNLEFDQAVSARSQAVEAMGAMPVEAVNIEERNRRIQDFEKKIDEMVSRRSGDYGSAAKDISRAIASERSDPFYEFARRQQEQGKLYRSTKARLGESFYSAKDPTQVSYNQYQQDPSALDFQHADIRNLEAMAAAKGKEQATSMRQFINRKVDGLMREVGYDYGTATQVAAQEWMQQNPEFIGDIMSGYGIDDPNVRGRLEQAALTQLVGKRDTRFTQDYEAILKLKTEEETGTPGFMGPSGQLYLVPGNATKRTSPVINKQAVDMASKAGLADITNYEDLLALVGNLKLNLRPEQVKYRGQFQGTGMSVEKTEDANKAKKILDKITLETENGISIPKYNFKTLSASAGNIRDFNTVKDEFTKILSSEIEVGLLKPVHEKDIEFFDELEKLDDFNKADIEITDVAYDTRQGGYGTGFIFEVKGKNKKGKIIKAMVALPRTSEENIRVEQDITRLLIRILPGFRELYLQDYMNE